MAKFFIFLSIFALHCVLFTESTFAVVRKNSCRTHLAPKAGDDAVQKGILSHGEHWVDLVLAQTSREGTTHLEAFEAFATQLLQSIHNRRMPIVNEKIDGSPSIVFGWDAKGSPFIAYKNHFSGATQKLVVDQETALTVFPRSVPLKKIFSSLFETLEPVMKDPRKLQDYIFQGDLLFVEDNERKVIAEDGIHIRANTVDYRIRPEDPIYGPIKQARVGVAIHSVGRRTLAEDGRVGVEALPGAALENRSLIEKFIAKTSHKKAFMISPLRDNVGLESQLSSNEVKEAEALLERVREDLNSLSLEFRQLARTHFESELRVFFNSQVRPPINGGYFRQIAEGQNVNPKNVAKDFGLWLKTRKNKAPSEHFEALKSMSRRQLIAAIEAYLSAIHLQYLILPHLSAAMKSKLGGGNVEGLILTEGDYIVKFVDRLAFTLANNQKRESLPQAVIDSRFVKFPAPFTSWKPETGMILMKGQPVHRGHIEMIKLAASRLGKVYVVASDKEPNWDATTISKLGSAPDIATYATRNYTHVFSNELRARIFKAALAGTDVEVHQISTNHIWNYLGTAQELGLPGKLKLVVGQKEVDEERYSEQLAQWGSKLELYPIPLQEGGISATQIRALVKDAALGSAEALRALDKEFSFIANQIERRSIVQQMLEEWKRLDAKVQELLAKSRKRPAAS